MISTGRASISLSVPTFIAETWCSSRFYIQSSKKTRLWTKPSHIQFFYADDAAAGFDGPNKFSCVLCPWRSLIMMVPRRNPSYLPPYQFISFLSIPPDAYPASCVQPFRAWNFETWIVDHKWDMDGGKSTKVEGWKMLPQEDQEFPLKVHPDLS